MDSQDATPDRSIRSKSATKRALKRARLRRQRHAAEAVHETCIARTARRILRDCDFAVKELEIETKPHAWRRRWFSSVTLLRAVGHGLKNEDSQRSTYLAEAAATAWVRWKTDLVCSQVFYGFIEDERNALLKQYDFWNERKIRRLYPQTTEGDKGAEQHLVLIGGQAVPPSRALRIAFEWWRAEIARLERYAANIRHLDHNVEISLGSRTRYRPLEIQAVAML